MYDYILVCPIMPNENGEFIAELYSSILQERRNDLMGLYLGAVYDD